MAQTLTWTELFPQDTLASEPIRKTFKDLKDEIYMRLALLKFPDKLPEESYELIRRLYHDNLITLWADEGHKFVVKHSECLKADAKADITAESLVYRFWLWEKCYIPLGLYWTDSYVTGRKLIGKRQEFIDELDPYWETSEYSKTESPIFVVYVRQQRGLESIPSGSGQSVKLYPHPYVNGTLKLHCLRKAETLSGNDDALAVEDENYQAVISYVIARALNDGKAILDLRAQLHDIKMENRSRDQIETIQLGFGGLEEPSNYD